MEQAVGAATEDLALAAKFGHVGFEDHARVVIQPSRHAQVDLKQRRCRGEEANGFHRGGQIIERFGREAVALKQGTSGLDGFRTARGLAKGAEQIEAARIKAFRLKQGSQTGLVALVEQAHRRSRRGFLALGGFGAEAKTGEHVTQQADVADAKRPALQARCVQHADGQRDDFGVDQGPGRTDDFDAVLVELAVTAGLEFLIAEACAVVGQTQRLGVHAQFIGDHAHDRCGQFRPQGQVPAALVLEGIELADDAGT